MKPCANTTRVHDLVKQTGRSMPFRVRGPQSSTTNNPETRRCEAAVISIVPGSATACTRAAIFGASPKTSVSFPAPGPTTTGPESIPILADNFGCAGSSLSLRWRRESPGPHALPVRRRCRAPLDSRRTPSHRRPGTWRRGRHIGRSNQRRRADSRLSSRAILRDRAWLTSRSSRPDRRIGWLNDAARHCAQPRTLLAPRPQHEGEPQIRVRCALRAKSGHWRIFESAFSTSAREPVGALDAKSCAFRILR